MVLDNNSQSLPDKIANYVRGKHLVEFVGQLLYKKKVFFCNLFSQEMKFFEFFGQIISNDLPPCN